MRSRRGSLPSHGMLISCEYGPDGHVDRIERAGIDAIFHRQLSRLAMLGRERDLAAIEARLGVVGRMDGEPEAPRDALRHGDRGAREEPAAE